MGDSFHGPGLRRNSQVTSVKTSKKVSTRCLNPSGFKSIVHKSLRPIASLNHRKMAIGTAGQVASFLLKVAALETVRRFSRARCPFVWSGLQALQVLCYPPFKWIQRWDPFKVLVKGMQVLSRPLLVLSIATVFSDHSESRNVTPDGIENSHDPNDSHRESHQELPSSSEQSTLDTRICDEVPQCQSTNWLLQLYAELGKQGTSLPQRISEDELHRFYTAADGDFSCFLSSVKKTIRWRETYGILSEQELEMWSNMIFWHGFDVKHRPCLIVRLGLACISLPSYDRPRFAQAVVSQVEHGVLHLVDDENPQITVLVDCEGLSPMRFPMQMMRSCSALLQDNFPNRLGCLFIIRLPPVVRVIAQTFIQVLKPVTRKKLKIEGEMYLKVLSEYLQTIPSYLGGTCMCMRCTNLSIYNIQQPGTNEEPDMREMSADISNGSDLPSLQPNYQTDMPMSGSCDQVLRAAIVGVLIFWVLIAFVAGIYDPESRPFLPA